MDNMVKIAVNGEEHEVEKGKRLLLILSGKGVKIPHLCFHHALVPGASCKLCVVEVKEKNKPPKTRLSCAIKTKEGLEITTESAMVHQLRNKAIGDLLKMAPRADIIHQIGEEFGLFGILMILGLYVLVLWRGIGIAISATDPFGSFLAIGLTTAIGLQVCVNMGVTLGLLPTKGLTLPFLSYGGTSLLINMASIGILMSIRTNSSK